ncbi:hypothetical protein LTR28_008374 [Elasticomyces elasticus]|nr:hypothetical protein LTR28_008374 [Elasticomyces elasticus]
MTTAMTAPPPTAPPITAPRLVDLCGVGSVVEVLVGLPTAVKTKTVDTPALPETTDVMVELDAEDDGDLSDGAAAAEDWAAAGVLAEGTLPIKDTALPFGRLKKVDEAMVQQLPCCLSPSQQYVIAGSITLGREAAFGVVAVLRSHTAEQRRKKNQGKETHLTQGRMRVPSRVRERIF